MSSEIAAIRTNGERFFGTYATALVCHIEDQLEPRIGFIVSKKINKNATDRNRTKRLLREAVQTLLPSIKPTASIVILAKSSLIEVPLQTVLKDISALFDKARLLD